MFLLDDFNIDLIHYNEHKPTNKFLDSPASNFYLPYIIQPSRHTSHSRTLIDNISSKLISKENPPSSKYNVLERDRSNFDQENFVLDYFDIDWTNILKLDEKKC